MCGAYTAVEAIRVHNFSAQVRLAEDNFYSISACLPGLKAYAIAGISDAPLDHVDTDHDSIVS